MKRRIEVQETDQFPQGLVDLSDLRGAETILMDARLRQELWLKGKATGDRPLFGTIRIHIGQGPHGFGFEAAPSVGDARLIVRTEQGSFPNIAHASIYELTDERIREIIDPRAWRPPR